MYEEREKIEATIQISINTCFNYVEDWDKFCFDIGIDPWTKNETAQLQLTLEQAKTHGII